MTQVNKTQFLFINSLNNVFKTFVKKTLNFINDKDIRFGQQKALLNNEESEWKH